MCLYLGYIWTGVPKKEQLLKNENNQTTDFSKHILGLLEDINHRSIHFITVDQICWMFANMESFYPHGLFSIDLFTASASYL